MPTYDDPRMLRAIAHPTRNRILAELDAAGPLRAADIAQLLAIPANQASFHLRQLAKYGLVEDAPDQARDKRDRVWRISGDGAISFRTREMLDQPGGQAAYAVFQGNARAWGHHLVDRALAVEPERGRRKSISDWALRLSAEESEQLMQELDALVSRWRERTRGADGERETYSIYQLIQPYPERESDSDGEEA